MDRGQFNKALNETGWFSGIPTVTLMEHVSRWRASARWPASTLTKTFVCTRHNHNSRDVSGIEMLAGRLGHCVYWVWHSWEKTK